MVKKSFKIIDHSGVQTNDATKLVQIANQFDSRINLEFADKMVDLKSELGLISLGLEYDSGIKIIVEGKDEQNAMKVIQETLITTNLAV